MAEHLDFRALLASLAALILLVATALMTASPVRAEGNCPPGYYPIGGGNGGFAGCAPIPGAGGSAGGGGARPRNSPHDAYYAVVSHPRSSDVWIMSNAPNREQIQQGALRLCGMAMGEGCKLEFSSIDSVAAMARGMDGDTYFAWAKSAAEADATVLAYCRKLSDFCAVFRHWSPSRNNGIQTYYPAQGSLRVYLSAAWVRDPSNGSHPDPAFYVSGGHASKEDAERSALDACRKQTGKPCDVARTVKDTFIVLARRSDGVAWISSSPSEAMAPVVVQSACEGSGLTCAIKSIIPASAGGVRRFSPLQ